MESLQIYPCNPYIFINKLLFSDSELLMIINREFLQNLNDEINSRVREKRSRISPKK